MMEKIKQQVYAIIVEHLDISEDKVIDTASFVKDLGADSLDAMDLLMAINENFDINIPAEKLDEIHTVADMINQVEKSL